MANFLTTGDLSDVTLEVHAQEHGDGGAIEMFEAHKLILSGRSSVFRRMFTGNFAEKSQVRCLLFLIIKKNTHLVNARIFFAQDIVKIRGIEPAVFRDMLIYIYKDTAPNIHLFADKLFLAADQVFFY